MKRTKRLIKIIAITLTVSCVIFFGIFFNPYMFPGCHSVKLDTFILETVDDFDELSATGRGLEDDPFVIQDLHFGSGIENVKEHYTLLTIRTNDIHLRIENSTFTGGYIAIDIQNVLSGSVKISNCSIRGTLMNYGCGWASIYDFTKNGIKISNSRNITVEGLVFMGEFYEVVYVEDTSNFTFLNNTGFDSSESLLYCVWNVSDIIVSNNTRFGLYIHGENNTIENNYISSDCVLIGNNIRFQNNFVAERCSFHLLYLNNSLIINNTLLAADRPEIEKSYNLTIIFNTIMNCTYYGLTLNDDTSNITIYNNSFINNVPSNPDAQSQCTDSGNSNYWYNSVLMIGNYWSDIGSNSTYIIDGPAGSVDLYPLSTPI